MHTYTSFIATSLPSRSYRVYCGIKIENQKIIKIKEKDANNAATKTSVYAMQ